MASKGTTALQGAGTGAAVGAAAGSVIPGVGTVIGGGVGAVVGGLAGWFGGGDDAAAPTYNPDQGNFSYGIGNYVDAQGVVHPTPEELAAQRAGSEQQRQRELDQNNARARQQAADAQQALPSLQQQLATLNPNDPDPNVQGKIYSLQTQIADAQKAIKAGTPEAEQLRQSISDRFASSPYASQMHAGGDDSYAAQRVRETVGKQGQIAQFGGNAVNRDAFQAGYTDSGGQQYLANADEASRAQQLQQLQALNKFASQGAPVQGASGAQAQLQAGTDMAARQQYSFARSQPGGGGAALRNAAFNAAGISGNAANQSAMLKAQEDAAYQQQLLAYKQQQLAALNSASGLAGQMRQGDQGFAATRAGQANTDAARMQDVNMANLASRNQNRAQGDATWLATTQLGYNYDAMRDDQARAQQGAGIAFEGAKAQGAGISSANFANQQQIDAQNRSEALAGASAAAGTIALGAKNDAAAAAAQNRSSGLSSGQGAYDASTAVSDRRAKTAVEKEHSLSKALETVGNAPGYSYEYKDPNQPGAKPGRQYGPMAQDLERGPLGDTLVKETPQGKVVDTGRVAMMTASAVTELNHKVKALEKALGKRVA